LGENLGRATRKKCPVGLPFIRNPEYAIRTTRKMMRKTQPPWDHPSSGETMSLDAEDLGMAGLAQPVRIEKDGFTVG